MKILFLGNGASSILGNAQHAGIAWWATCDPITLTLIQNLCITFIVSYNYQHIIPRHIVDYYRHSIINLHISYLPWNRGSDPNLWSFLDSTPTGVTIHNIDESIDTGDILIQKNVYFDYNNDTLITTHKKLSDEIETLFNIHFFDIIQKNIIPKKQKENGSFHREKDKIQYLHLLKEHGYNTKINTLYGYACRSAHNE